MTTPNVAEKHVTRDAQPVSPRPVLPGLVHQALADIEDHGTDHAATLSGAVTRTRACNWVAVAWRRLLY